MIAAAFIKIIQKRKEVNKMPRGDRTGPWGAGPMTGRARGYCAGYSGPGFLYPGPGLGFGRGFGGGFGRAWGFGRGYGRGLGFGRGRGWRRGGFAPFWGYPSMMDYGPEYWPEYPASRPTRVDTKEEKQYLEEQMGFLQEELTEINKRLEELKKQEKEKK